MDVGCLMVGWPLVQPVSLILLPIHMHSAQHVPSIDSRISPPPPPQRQQERIILRLGFHMQKYHYYKILQAKILPTTRILRLPLQASKIQTCKDFPKRQRFKLSSLWGRKSASSALTVESTGKLSSLSQSFLFKQVKHEETSQFDK